MIEWVMAHLAYPTKLALAVYTYFIYVPLLYKLYISSYSLLSTVRICD